MRTCKHIKANGEFCGSPPLRDREYCYFHLTVLGRRLRTQKHILKGECHYLQLPTLEDADSVQLAVMQVMDALLRDQIDTKVAGLLLYGLQIASSNLQQGANFEQDKSASSVVGSYDSFEQDYDLADTDCELKVREAEEADEEQNEVGGAEGVGHADEGQPAEPNKTGVGEAPAQLAQHGRTAPERLRIQKDAGRQGFKVRLPPERDETQLGEKAREIA